MQNFSQRDSRLDFWRALCLIDMVLVHLVYDGVNFGPIQRAIGEYTRFAAGGFVFVAGLSIGAIFLPRTFAPAGQKKVYFSLWRRAAYILCIHFAATLSFVSLDLIRGMRADAPQILSLLRDILFFREGGDLLPLYVIVVAASPGMLELLRRRAWVVLALISAGLFIFGQYHPWAFSTPLQQNFPVVLWQLIFVSGMLFGAVLPKFTDLSQSKKLIIASAATALSILLWAGDFRSDFGWTQPVLPMAFIKTPLSIGEAVRYLAIIFTIIGWTELMWHRIGNLRWINQIAGVGRRSLAVYVAHVWVVGLLSLLAWHTTQLGGWQGLFAIPAVISLWLLTRAMDWVDTHPFKLSLPAFARLPQSRWGAIPVGVAASFVALLITARAFPPIVAVPVQNTNWEASLGSSEDDSNPFDLNPVGPVIDLSDSPDIISV